MPRAPRSMRSLIVMMTALMIALSSAIAQAQEAPPAQPPSEPLTVQQVLALLQQGTTAGTLLERIRRDGGSFDLTIEDVMKLRAAGAPVELIRLMARAGAGSDMAEQVDQQTMAEVPEPSPGALTAQQVMELHGKGVPPDQIAAQIAAKGIAEPPDIDQIVAWRAQGIPDVILRAMAGTAPPPPAAAAKPAATPPPAATAPPAAPAPAAEGRPARSRHATPLTTADVIWMLETREPAERIVAEIERRGVKSAPTLDEGIALKKAGANDAVLVALNDAAPEEPETEAGAGQEAGAGRARASKDLLTLPPPGQDQLWITSTPQGARVHVAPSRTRLADTLRHDYLVGRTPLALPLPPGDYRVVVVKDAGAFEAGLVPAWRTLHDNAASRTLLDNADLTFDPERCCLPGTLSGTVDVRPIPSETQRGVIGDLFGGLPPFLFDGESTQILRVHDGRIVSAMKAYEVRKNAGQERTLVSTFIPSEGDPLDAAASGLAEGTPFDSWVEAESLGFLTEPEGVAALASVLGVQPDHLTDAVAILRKAGKAILHQPLPDGFRLLAISVDEDGRLRVDDQKIQPADPFAPAPPPSKTKRKKTPPAPPALPQMDREVVPGLGLPRLVLDNKTSHALGLLFSDSEFCFVAAKSRSECVVDPGTVEAKVLGVTSGLPPQGTLHFSYHARYTITF